MTVVEAARVAGMAAEAAELAYHFIDASYRSIDVRVPDEYGNIPGITRENRRLVTSGKWETDYVNSGIEGYGWGAVSVFLLIRAVMGLKEDEEGTLTVTPMLPQALRKPGASFTIGPLPWGKHSLTATCSVHDRQSYRMNLACSSQQWQWDGTWGDERKIMLV
jgi:hypothetical protein